jgi:PAS domain S-box-containing protein
VEGKCVKVNPTAEQILQKAEVEIEGRSIEELGFDSASSEQLKGAFAEALGGRVGAARAVSVSPAGGEVHYVDANFRKFAGEGGKALVQMTVRDVSERVAAERASRLAEARAEKAERLEAIGRLAGGVAHDFNNILTVILGNAELLKMVSPSEEAQQIAQAAQTAKELTTQLLTFSKHDAATDATADLRRVVEDSQALLKPLLSEKVELRLELDDGLPRVRGDGGQLQQVLMNLCINSRDAMPDGGRVTIRAKSIEREREGTNTPAVCLSVEDTGTGMDAATHQRAFEPFFSTKPKGRGTGLGLATVFGIVRASGGEVRLTSTPGKGTRVDIELPTAEALEQETKAPSAPPPAGGTGRLLLVEDEADVLRVTHKLLESAGHQVLAANSPDQALELASAREARFDAIITDVVMPGMDGPALAKRLTEILGPTPVLYVSGYMPDQVGHDLELGVNCLSKPVKASVLLGHVAALLRREAPGGSSAA